MKNSDLNISHGIEPLYFKRTKSITMKKVKLNCGVQSYFGIKLLRTTLNDLIESNSKISIIEFDYDENEDTINGFQLLIQYETLENLLKIVAEISRTFEMIQIDEHCDSYGFWIESVIEE